MRLLSNEEMDNIFGGDGTIIPTMPTTHVTAAAYNNSGVPFVSGPQFGWDEANGGGSTSGCGTLTANRALSSLPSTSKLRCQLNAAAAPGANLASGYEIILVNAYAFMSLTNQGAYAPGDLYMRSTSTAPSGQWDVIYGGTQSQGYHRTYLYAHGMTRFDGEVEYTDGQGQTHTMQGPFSASEWPVFVLAHEAAHQHGIVDESTAEWYGVLALNSFRAGAGANCP